MLRRKVVTPARVLPGARVVFRLLTVHVLSPCRCTDRSDWLKADMPLRCQMVDPSDSLLLVRQEKILSFIDRHVPARHFLCAH